MVDDFLSGLDWDEPPEEMGFEAPYGRILDECCELVAAVRAAAGDFEEASRSALRLYVRAPALVNVILNYKICVEHGLPLHPTVYYELQEARRYRMDHPIAELEVANRLYFAAIELARSACRLDADFADRALVFRSYLPSEILRFVYTGGRDKYSWRGAEPDKLKALAEKTRKGFEPDLIVAAAHGAIMPALLLAEYLGLPLYFIRFSMFKRKDESPIISLSDHVWLSTWKEKRALFYDEDVAKGTTLELFTARLSPLFAETRSSCSIRHAGSSFAPDFVAKYWWD